MDNETLEVMTSAIFGLVIFFILMAVFFSRLSRSKKNIFATEMPVQDKKTGYFVVTPKNLYYEAFNFLWSTSTFMTVFSVFMGLSKEVGMERSIYLSILIVSISMLVFSLLFYFQTIGRRVLYNDHEFQVISIWKKQVSVSFKKIVDVIEYKQHLLIVREDHLMIKIHVLADGFRHFANTIYPFLNEQAAKILIANVYTVRPVTYYPNPNESVTCDLASHKVIKLLKSDTVFEVKIKIPIDNEAVFEEDGWVNRVVEAINEITNYSIRMEFICIGYTINLFDRNIKVFFYMLDRDLEDLTSLILDEFDASHIDLEAISTNHYSDPNHMTFYEVLPNDFHFEYMITSYKLEVLSKELDLKEELELYFRIFYQNVDAYESSRIDLKRLGLIVVEQGFYDVDDKIKTYLDVRYDYEIIVKKKMSLSQIELNAITDNLVGMCKERNGSFGLWAISLEDAKEEFHFEQNKRLL